MNGNTAIASSARQTGDPSGPAGCSPAHVRAPVPAFQFTAPKTIDSMCEAFDQYCRDGGTDFIDHLKSWNMKHALGVINDAAQNYTPTAAIGIIKEALEELFEIAAQGHREEIEADI